MNLQKEIEFSIVAIKRLDLDLTGINLLTEAGSGSFMLTPIIGALANSRKVMAWTYDSEYGKAGEIIDDCLKELSFLGLEKKVEFFNGRLNPEHLAEADIITNSWFLRPLDAGKLKFCKKGTVISLMYEEWEFREKEIDLEFCTSRGIKVAGTWEEHPEVDIFRSIDSLAIKMALEAGFEIVNQQIVVWSDDRLGEFIKESFRKYGAGTVINTVDFELVMGLASFTNFIFICDYSEVRDYSDGSFFSFSEIKRINPRIGIIHLYGALLYKSASNFGLKIYPERDGYAQKMSFTFSHLGPEPVINLVAAGLKVGEMVIKNPPGRLVQPINFTF